MNNFVAVKIWPSDNAALDCDTHASGSLHTNEHTYLLNLLHLIRLALLKQVEPKLGRLGG
jgi:hypothetical protein